MSVDLVGGGIISNRSVHCVRNRKLYYRIAERWFPLGALVWWDSRGQKAWHGAGRQNRRKRPLSEAIRQNHPRPCGAPRTSDCACAEIAARAERAVSG